MGSAFTSVGGHGRGFGGHEAILQSFHATFLQHGMVYTPLAVVHSMHLVSAVRNLTSVCILLVMHVQHSCTAKHGLHLACDMLLSYVVSMAVAVSD